MINSSAHLEKNPSTLRFANVSFACIVTCRAKNLSALFRFASADQYTAKETDCISARQSPTSHKKFKLLFAHGKTINQHINCVLYMKCPEMRLLCVQLFYLTNRLQTHRRHKSGQRLVATFFLFLPHSDVICDLFLKGQGLNVICVL